MAAEANGLHRPDVVCRAKCGKRRKGEDWELARPGRWQDIPAGLNVGGASDELCAKGVAVVLSSCMDVGSVDSGVWNGGQRILDLLAGIALAVIAIVVGVIAIIRHNRGRLRWWVGGSSGRGRLRVILHKLGSHIRWHGLADVIVCCQSVVKRTHTCASGDESPGACICTQTCTTPFLACVEEAY